jgi:hypothetical protein
LEQHHIPGNPRSTGHPSEAGGIHTETLARLYAKQGLYDQALRIYRHLLQTQPDNLDWQRTIAALERQHATNTAPHGVTARALQTASGKRPGKGQMRLRQVVAQLERWLEQLRQQRQI